MSESQGTALTVEEAEDLLRQARRFGVWQQNGELTAVGQDLFGALWRYAFGTLQTILREGVLLERVARLGVRTGAFEPVHAAEWGMIQQRHEVREDLAADMIERAWPRFATNVVTRNTWNAEASQLTTYWVNACLQRSVSAVRRWAREQAHVRGATHTLVRRSQQRNLFAAVEDREQYRAIIDVAPAPVRDILTLLALDYDYSEIAARLSIRRTTVANRLFDFRRKIVLPALLDGDLHAPNGHVLQEITERVQEEAW